MNWFIRLKDLFDRGLIDMDRLENAVTKNLITAEEKAEIMAQ